MKDDQAQSRLIELDRTECVELLATVPVGRIGLSVAALPVILPVNFAVSDESVLFRTAAGTKLDAASQRSVVAFQADRYAPDGLSGWSVLVVGLCEQVPESDAAVVAGSVPIESWALDGVATHLVRVEMATVTGRAFGAYRSGSPGDGTASR